VDRVDDTLREFPTCVVLGGHAEHVLRALPSLRRARVRRALVLDSSRAMLERAARVAREDWGAEPVWSGEGAAPGVPPAGGGPGPGGAEGAGGEGAGTPPPRVELVGLAGAGERLPLADGSADVVLAPMSLHWTNDLPGLLGECRRVLRPDGLFLAALAGGETLQELRIALSCAEREREGGVGARVSPMARVRDGGNLLERAGMALPTVDVDTVEVVYPSPAALVRHLRALGESNAVAGGPRPLRWDTWAAASAIYGDAFAHRESGGVSATLQVVYLGGWAPAEGQPRAARRGSATVSLHQLDEALRAQGGAGGGAPARGGGDG